VGFHAPLYSEPIEQLDSVRGQSTFYTGSNAMPSMISIADGVIRPRAVASSELKAKDHASDSPHTEAAKSILPPEFSPAPLSALRDAAIIQVPDHIEDSAMAISCRALTLYDIARLLALPRAP